MSQASAYINILPETTEKDLDELISEMTAENKHFIIKALGFKRAGCAGLWKHGVIGPEEIFNYNMIEFDVNNDELFMLVNRIYKLGRQHAKDELIKDFKKLFNIEQDGQIC